MTVPYPPLDVRVVTPVLELRGATDDELAMLAPLVRAGEADAIPLPYDDPISLYEADPDKRVAQWLRAVWRGRGSLDPGSWRLAFSVVVDGERVGMQDLIGVRYDSFGTVVTFSWVARSCRRRGIGREMRSAVLHLAFDGLDATEAGSAAFADNVGSNRISETLGYVRNGTAWDTRQGEPAVIQQWRLGREAWLARRRTDITVRGAAECRRTLGIGIGADPGPHLRAVPSGGGDRGAV